MLVLQGLVWNVVLVTLIQRQCYGKMTVIEVPGWGEWCGRPGQKGQGGDKLNFKKNIFYCQLLLNYSNNRKFDKRLRLFFKIVISVRGGHNECSPRTSEHLHAPLFSKSRHNEGRYDESVHFPLVIKLHGYVKDSHKAFPPK
jgi:hypothetical protein